jgi:dihydrofolate synthase/folylpolyglutamate synthase
MESQNQIKSEILKNLFSKHRLGIKPGLERTIALAESVGNPQNLYDTIHVAGTNGKGTTCSVASSILIESGLKVGLYTSPHIKEFNERIRVNGVAMSDDELIDYAQSLLPYSEEMDATFFEITTVMAFLYFADKGVDVAVVETGMGGRFDSTNIILPKVCIITDIDMDHEEFLGNTIEQIAMEKAGIIKRGIPIITTNTVSSVLGVISEKAKSETAELIEAEKSAIEPAVSEFIDLKYISLSFKKNYKAALLACERYLSGGVSFGVQMSAVEGLEKNAGYFARLQVLETEPICLLDISHSVAAAQNLVTSLQAKYGNKKWTVILTLMNDKDYRGIIDVLAGIADMMILTQVENERSMMAVDLYEYAELAGINSKMIAVPRKARAIAK